MDFHLNFLVDYDKNSTKYTLSKAAYEDVVNYYVTANEVKDISVMDPSLVLQALVDKYFSAFDIPWPRNNKLVEIREAYFGRRPYTKKLAVVIAMVQEQRWVMTIAERELKQSEINDGQMRYKGI